MYIFIIIYLVIWAYIKYETEFKFPLSKIKPNYGVLFRTNSFWIGLHYSPYNKRYCLNLLPFFTIWWIKQNGNPPLKNRY